MWLMLSSVRFVMAKKHEVDLGAPKLKRVVEYTCRVVADKGNMILCFAHLFTPGRNKQFVPILKSSELATWITSKRHSSNLLNG